MANISERRRTCWFCIAVIDTGYFGINPPGFVTRGRALAFGLAAFFIIPSYHSGILTENEQRRRYSQVWL
jgi:Na+(H+)/acetate symporter ActP